MDVVDVPNLPEWLPDHLADSGIEELYPPQAAAVEAGATEGAHLVASVPTASGKTLIAQLAMLSALERGGTALYIVPLRALASEKRAEFEELEAHGVDIGVATGNYESDGEWLASRDVIVATSEKVDSLVRNGAPWIEDLTCVVADEVHLVDDRERGPTLEVTLAKLRKLNPGAQLVALSATIGNADAIARWLDAELIDSTWRPIELRTGVHFGQALHLDDGEKRELGVERGEKQTLAIVRDALGEGGSSLVFVNSRRNAEAAARRLGGTTEPALDGDERERLATLAEEIRGVSDTETSEDLAGAVESGAAFHHAGLASEHRAMIEDAFRDRLVKAVAATPTLAAGVNTPARRVIVRDWRRYDGSVGGMAPLSVLEVHQMFGRAGRPGLDPYGEAVLLANSHDELEELFERYVWAEPEPVRSKLAAEPALRTHLLSTVASGFASTRDGLLEFLDNTLYAEQTDEPGRLASVADDVLAYLEVNDFIERDGETIAATNLGHTVSRLYLDPMSAAGIIDGLEDWADAHGGDPGEVGEPPTALGLYHLVSRTPDMYELYLRSGDRELYTELAYEHETEFLGSMPSEFEDERFEDWLSALKTARLLEDWADEVDEDRITERYRVGPGDIRGKVDTASWLLGAAESVAGAVGFEGVGAIAEARMRVEHGVREELLDLVGVREVGRKRARRLFRAGVETRADLREAPKSLVLGALRGREATAETVLRNAGRQDPSVEGVTPDEDARPDDPGVEDDEDEAESQASLGDF